jgi:hypothetical protein
VFVALAQSACTEGVMQGGPGPQGAPAEMTPPAMMETPPASNLPSGSAETPAEVAACRGLPPAPTFHRLNRSEYHNSVNALLGTNLPLRDQLPPDALIGGFDNNGDRAISAPLVQRYLALATHAVETALGDARSRADLVPCPPQEAGCVRKVVAAFLPRAYRRPVTPDEIDEIAGYAAICDDGSAQPLAGVACALEAALVSPSFLFRGELLADEAQTCTAERPLQATATALTPHALAARLAAFLWSGAPDAQLLALADSGQLNDPAVIEAQVNRMLAPAEQERHVRALVEGLPTQWLELDGLAGAAPSPTLYPRFDAGLAQAMTGESRRFFAELLHQNRPLYGLKDVVGTELRRVATADTPRGGVLSQASFLTLTSSSEKTSIPLRARWVLSNVLCTTLGDPPPGAEEMVPAPDPALGLTSRESLERRTGRQPCAACHAILNPIGFGLEGFDAIGAARTTENGRPIDTSGVLPSGETFRDAGEMLALLKSDTRFPACFTRKLLTYALGRTLSGACDEAVVAALAADFARDGFRLKNHVVRVARSPLFRSVRLRAEGTP